jgi:anaerobic selenocysteine-containing dehydrogenase
MSGLTRRELLVAGAAGSLALSLRALRPLAGAAAPAAAAAAEPPAYGGFADVYRAAWRWDRVVRGTHLRANCFSACAFDLYVKDGVVWREEQADVYARAVAARPDFAPRGCQKGACYSDLMLAPGRLTHPLERVGERGSGRWRRISWEAALGRLADAILDAVAEGGPETVVFDNGTSNVDSGPSTSGEMRLFSLLGATLLDGFGGTGDLAMGAFQTWGTSFVDGSSDDWFRADALVFWHCNPTVTRIPDFHFATEARYRGATVIAVCPDFSPTAVHASLWVNPHLGTDAALALGVARHSSSAARSTRPTCASRPTCRSSCVTTPGASSARPTSGRAGGRTSSACSTRRRGRWPRPPAARAAGATRWRSARSGPRSRAASRSRRASAASPCAPCWNGCGSGSPPTRRSTWRR